MLEEGCQEDIERKSETVFSFLMRRYEIYGGTKSKADYRQAKYGVYR